ncbi:hypothetical protein IJ384_06790 [bacterium]|nr:hypothetical protein [bacterium]
MFTRESILKSLNTENYYIDKHSLDLFLHDWNVESIYEDESGLEFYDDLSLEKIKRGISLKTQGYSDEQIISKLKRMEAKVEKTSKDERVQPISIKDYFDIPVETKESAITTTENVEVVDLTPKFIPEKIEEEVSTQNEIVQQKEKSFTLDVTSQTLQMLAEAVAKKISDDITNSDMATKLIEAGGYKKDNEILAKQVQELLEHNRELSARIEQLESHTTRNFWNRFWGKR